jgi:quinol monooxygenase YgiN
MTNTTIDAEAKAVTLINVFLVAPARQRALVDKIARDVEEVMRHQPGFISANVHASLDGTRVVNYAQWETEDAFRAMLADPACQERITAANQLANAEPLLYTVESVHHR